MTIWYIARGAGLAALLLLTVSTCLGALASSGGKPDSRFVLQYVHRAAASLGLTALVLHVATILADSYANVGWAGAIIPFTSTYRPLWVGLGTLAVYTVAAVAVLGFARHRMARSVRGAKLWRGLHATAYAGWAMAMLHGLKSGTDTGVSWVRLIYLGCALAVTAAVLLRLSGRPATPVTPRPAPMAVAR